MPHVQLIQSSLSGDQWTEYPIQFASKQTHARAITLDPQLVYHEFLGVGGDLTECTCYNVMQLDEAQRQQFIRSLFDPTEGAGWSLVRDDIGSADFSKARYSFAETPDDITLQSFSTAREALYNYPVMDRAVAVNPNLQFIGSPWSPPAWMKDTGSMVGPKGKLLKKYYPVYSAYLVKYIQSMLDRGYDLIAITPQNEPEADHGSDVNAMPQCLYTADEERDFVQNYLRPALEKHHLDTAIWGMDHNFDMLDYAQTLLAGDHPYQALAYHHYVGKPYMMQHIHQQYNIPCHFTEGQLRDWCQRDTDYDPHGSSLARLIRSGSGSFFNWITLLDSDGGPGEGEFIYPRNIHDGRTFDIAIMDVKTRQLHYNGAYWMTGHLGRYVPRGAKVIYSSDVLDNVCFQHSRDIILYVENNTPRCEETSFSILLGDRVINTSIPAYAVQTYIIQL